MRADTRPREWADDPLIDLAVEVFSMLADATRVRIIRALTEHDELAVNELADLVDKSPSAVSQHLAKLRLVRIVATRHDGQRVYYRLANEHAAQLVTDAMHQAEHSQGDTPLHHRAMAPHLVEHRAAGDRA